MLAVSDLKILGPTPMDLKLFNSAIFTSFSEKPPSGPIKIETELIFYYF